jgi:RNA polymerase sigma factor (sigma-70 family)
MADPLACRALTTPSPGAPTDGALLERFVRLREEDAFAELVRRHGPLVYGVCRRLTPSYHDAEDAFQTTFLLLARKAGSINRRESVGCWLYGVALRVARKAARAVSRRPAPLAEFPDLPADDGPDPAWRDLRPVLDEEVGRLPAAFRRAVVLCYLEGQTAEEAARALGCPRGTVLSRLARARDRLRGRLERRGVTLSAGALTAVLAFAPTAEAVPPDLAAAAADAALTPGAKPTMFPLPLKLLSALALTLAAAGAGLLSYLTLRPPETGPAPEAETDGWELVATLPAGDLPVRALAFAPDGQTLASAGEDRAVKLWDVRTGRELRELRGHANFVFSVAFSPDGKTLATGGMSSGNTRDTTVRLWDAATGKEVTSLEHTAGHHSLAFSPDGKTLAAGSGPVRLWELSAGAPKVRAELDVPEGVVHAVAFSPDGKVLASAADRTVRLWDPVSGKLFARSDGKDQVFAVAFSPDGRVLAVSGRGEDRTGPIHLLEVPTGKEIRRISGHRFGVTALAFSPDGKTLVSGSDDKTVRIWDVTTGKEIGVLAGNRGAVTALAVSADGKWMATVGGDGTIQIWRRRGTAAAQAGRPAEGGPAAGAPPGPADADDRFARLVDELIKSGRSNDQIVEALFLAALGRLPHDTEKGFITTQVGRQPDRRKALEDVVWALANSREYATHLEYLQKYDPRRALKGRP